VAGREAVTWPGLPRLLYDLERVKRAAEDTTAPDAKAAAELASGISAAAPVRTGYLAASVGPSGAEVGFAYYGTFVDKGTSRMAAHPFVSQGVSVALTQAEDVYAEHLEDSFRPVIGSRY
jgi:hypothetical protein